jgi:hypothetical protein
MWKMFSDRISLNDRAFSFWVSLAVSAVVTIVCFAMLAAIAKTVRRISYVIHGLAAGSGLEAALLTQVNSQSFF